MTDATHDPRLRSWYPVAPDSDFPIQNLPLGVFRTVGAPHLAVAIGDAMLDLYVVAASGLLDAVVPDARAIFMAPALHALLAAGRPVWRALRSEVSGLLRDGDGRMQRAELRDAVQPQAGATLLLPFEVADYVDFYSSLEHATNLGKILRPGSEPLLPNWRHMPIGYHGRGSTVVASPTPVVRPKGQRRDGDAPPEYVATRALDFELEVAAITGDATEVRDLGVREAEGIIFGFALLNDWSARDIQAWEYQPLGPFLGKSFASSLSPWIVTLDALEPFRTRGPVQQPEPLPHLRAQADEAYDIALEVALSSPAMRAGDLAADVIARTNFKGMYWSPAQQLAHVASNGTRIRAGDLYGSGTISGSEPASFGSMIELTWRGSRPLFLADGTTRSFLQDGDEVIMRGRSTRDGFVSIGFGECRGRVLPAT